ncbi:MAG: AAA family ATPase [Deltaproteobacteria bacterium]|nr:AAA family ATPase [Deltaproteobacteria bacterium]
MPLAFDDFVFDEEQWELRKANTVLKVDAKLLQLLSYFLKHSGKFVSKQELLSEVWEGRVLSDNVLSVSITRLRKALGHEEGVREYIVNIYGRGYRFLPRVTTVRSEVIETGSSDKLAWGSAGSTPLVGRGSVMQRLDSALEKARAGTGGILMLAGEPGIGKTAVAKALSESGTISGSLWAWAHCHCLESEPPLWVWTQILRGYLHTELSEDIRRVLDERISELTRITEEGRCGNDLGRKVSVTGHKAFDGILQVLRRLSEQRTLVLLLDDLQWADSASLRLLSYLVIEIARWSILVVGTLRTTEFDPKDSRNKHLSYVLGHTNCETLVLNRLNETDIANYVTALFGKADAGLSRRVYEKSEGNPFFMVELLRPWKHSRRPQPDEIGFTAFALDIVRQRVRKLEAETRRILSAAAVIGRAFDLTMLGYLTERERDALLDLLEQPLADDTIVSSSEGPERFAFSHDLIREVLYQDLKVSERKAWHLRAGEWLEKQRASDAEVATAELAHHFLSALPQGQVAKAVSYADNAAQEAAHFYAYADVFTYLNRAIQALRSVEKPDLQLLCRLLLFLSLTARGLSDSRYLDYLNQAIKLATEHGFSRLLAMAGQQLSVVPGIVALPGALRVLEAAESMLPAQDKQERAMVLAHLAWTPPNCMSTRRANELLHEAERLARESKSSLALTTVLRGKLFFTGNPAEYPAAQAIIDELERVVRSEPELWTLPSLGIQLFRMTSSVQRGDQRAIREAIDGFGEKARKYKAIELTWFHQRLAIVQRMNAGELNGVSEALSELRERAEGLGLESGRMLCDLDSGVLLSLTGDIRPFAAELKDRLKVDESDSPNIWASKIQKMAELGLLKEAENALRRVSVTEIYELPVDLCYLATFANLALGSVAVRATHYIGAVYELLTPYPQYYAASLSFHCDGSISYYLGVLARALGRNRDAVSHLEAALEQNARFGLKAHVIRTRCELARALAGDTSRTAQKRARSLVKQAMEDAQKLGLHRLFNDARLLLENF